MAVFSERVPENVPGPMYVDTQCIYCGLCVELAPTVFRKVSGEEYAAVFHQPANEEERRACSEAIRDCPYECIGYDGVPQAGS